MKTIYILTLFPEMFSSFLDNSIIKRAIAFKSVEVKLVNIRDFTLDKHGRVDSAPIGGGAGLIQKCQPIVDALRSIDNPNTKKILMSARGKTFNQEMAHDFASMDEDLVILCGHYEGTDERINNYVDELVSLGDFILTGGECAAMTISDAVIRLLNGAITHESTVEESFENGLLEYPQYAEPYDFEGYKVPDILYSGNHQAINKWRKKESLRLTKAYRKDLFDKYPLSKQDYKLLEEIDSGVKLPKWEEEAIKKGIKFKKS